MRKAFLVLAASVLAAGSAAAQEVYIEDDAALYDDPVIEEPAYVDETVIERAEEPVDEEPRALGPRVYGWDSTEPPTSCGTFKYWNGEYCADARSEPPATD